MVIASDGHLVGLFSLEEAGRGISFGSELFNSSCGFHYPTLLCWCVKSQHTPAHTHMHAHTQTHTAMAYSHALFCLLGNPLPPTTPTLICYLSEKPRTHRDIISQPQPSVPFCFLSTCFNFLSHTQNTEINLCVCLCCVAVLACLLLFFSHYVHDFFTVCLCFRSMRK